MRECITCGARIGIRATRCPPCRRAYRTSYEAERAEKARLAAQESSASYDVSSTEMGLELVDYTVPGSASKVPSFSGVPPKAKPVPAQQVITDGRVPSPAERQYRPSLTGIPNSIRRDRVKLNAELARQKIGEEEDASDVTSWDELQSRNARQNDGRTVVFDRPALPPPGARPVRQVDYLGRSIPRARWS